MQTRRQFVKGIGAGLLLPSVWDQLANYLESYGEPLLRPPRAVKDTLYATRWSEDFQLSLNTDEDEMPPASMSIRDYISFFADGDDPGCWYTEDYEQPIGDFFVWEIWPYHYSSSARAFYFLSGLDLGDLCRCSDTGKGYLNFVENPSPGNDSRFVCTDELGASILQDRLNEYGHEVQIILR